MLGFSSGPSRRRARAGPTLFLWVGASSSAQVSALGLSSFRGLDLPHDEPPRPPSGPRSTFLQAGHGRDQATSPSGDGGKAKGDGEDAENKAARCFPYTRPWLDLSEKEAAGMRIQLQDLLPDAPIVEHTGESDPCPKHEDSRSCTLLEPGAKCEWSRIDGNHMKECTMSAADSSRGPHDQHPERRQLCAAQRDPKACDWMVQHVDDKAAICVWHEDVHLGLRKAQSTSCHGATSDYVFVSMCMYGHDHLVMIMSDSSPPMIVVPLPDSFGIY